MRTAVEEPRYKELRDLLLSNGRKLTPEEMEEWNRLVLLPPWEPTYVKRRNRMDNYQKYGLIVVALVATATISFRIGQEQSKDVYEKKEHSWQVVTDLQDKEIKSLTEVAQNNLLVGVALAEDCHLKNDEKACAYLKQQVAEMRARAASEGK